MRVVRSIGVSCIAFLLLSPGGSAQQSGAAPLGTESVPWGMGAAKTYNSRGSMLLLTVLGDNKAHLDRQAVVKLSNTTTNNVVWQTTADNSEAEFGDLTVGKYEIEVSAFGYLSEHKDLPVGAAINTYRTEIVLKRDPSAIDLKAPTKLPSKARKATQRGVNAIVSSNLKEAQKQFDIAYKLAPKSSEVNFLQGFLSFQKKDFKQAEIYLNLAATLDSRNSEALTLLGRLRLARADYPGAQTELEQAIATDPNSWMAHNLLADAYLRQNQFDKARVQAELAIEKGKGGGNAAELALGEALANLGQPNEAIRALNSFLQYTPKSPSAPQVHELIAKLERPNIGRPNDSATADVPLTLGTSSAQGLDLLLADTAPDLAAKSWEPPGIDQVRPPVAADVACPSETVIKNTEEGVKQFVEDVSRFNAIEDLVHEDLNQFGDPVRKETRKFNYVVSISEPKPGMLSVDEFRLGRGDVGDFPDQIATRGVPALALVFHPDMVDDFQVTCEGLSQWNGKAMWLLHFVQREGRPSRIRTYKIGGQSYPVDIKGRAWITADTYHLVRIESELVSPMKQIQLLSEHYTVDYAPVKFQKKNVELWLPKDAELYFHFRKHRYFRRHTFDDFMLFSVDTEEKTKEPKPQSDSLPPS